MMTTVAAGKSCLDYLDVAFSDTNIYNLLLTDYTSESITRLYTKMAGYCRGFLVQYADECYCRVTFISSVQLLTFGKKLYNVCRDLGLTLL